MNRSICNLSQKWVNYFPPDSVARKYTFSNARMLLNPVASMVYREKSKFSKMLKDLKPASHSMYDIDNIYKVSNVNNINTDTCLVTGYLPNGDSVSTSVYIHKNVYDFIEDVYTNPPAYIRQDSTEAIEGFDYIMNPSGFAYEWMPPSAIHINTSYLKPCFYFFNVFANSRIMATTDRYVEIYGRLTDSPFGNEDVCEKINVINDGVCYSKYSWNVITKVRFINLDNTIAKFQLGDYRLPLRPNQSMYISEERDPVNTVLAWDTSSKALVVARPKTSPAMDLVYDNIVITKLADENGVAFDDVRDFMYEPISDLVIATTGDALYFYDSFITVPSSIGVIQTIANPRFTAQLELYDDATLWIKLLASSIDVSTCLLAVTNPDGTKYMFNQYRSIIPFVLPANETDLYDMFKFHVHYPMPEAGVYKISIYYMDLNNTDLQVTELLYHYEKKEPLAVITPGGAVDGLCVVGKNFYYLYNDGVLTPYKGYKPTAVFDFESKSLLFFDIIPSVVNLNGTVFSNDTTDYLTKDREFEFGNIEIVGDL